MHISRSEIVIAENADHLVGDRQQELQSMINTVHQRSIPVHGAKVREMETVCLQSMAWSCCTSSPPAALSLVQQGKVVALGNRKQLIVWYGTAYSCPILHIA